MLAGIGAAQDQALFRAGEQWQVPGRGRQAPGVHAQTEDVGKVQAPNFQEAQDLDAGGLNPRSGQDNPLCPDFEPLQKLPGRKSLRPQGGFQFGQERNEAIPGLPVGLTEPPGKPQFLPDGLEEAAPLARRGGGQLQRTPDPVQPLQHGSLGLGGPGAEHRLAQLLPPLIHPPLPEGPVPVSRGAAMALHLAIIRRQEQGDQVFPALARGDEGQGQQGGPEDRDFGQARPLGKIVGPALRGLGRPQQFGQNPPQLGDIGIDIGGGDGQPVQRHPAAGEVHQLGRYPVQFLTGVRKSRRLAHVRKVAPHLEVDHPGAAADLL